MAHRDLLQANDNSGFIGAAIVGAFIFVVVGWHGIKWFVRKYKTGREQLSGA
jgi:nickel/cobalt transporter (NiCoT) family protein